MKYSRMIGLAASTLLLCGPAQAANLVLSGFFDDPGNAALTGSDLGAAQFGNDNEIANNVAIYTLVVPFAGAVRFDSNGFAAGGADPYFTLFQGSDATATVLQSNYAQAVCCGGDFDDTHVLVAGNYTIALGVFFNMSFAENLGAGTLVDGFVALGDPNWLGNYYYELSVTVPDSGGTVPEPGTGVLLAFGLLGLGIARWRSGGRVPQPDFNRIALNEHGG